MNIQAEPDFYYLMFILFPSSNLGLKIKHVSFIGVSLSLHINQIFLFYLQASVENSDKPNRQNASWTGGKTGSRTPKRKQSAIKTKIGVVWKHPCASLLTILKLGLCHVISIVSIFRCCVMKHHYVMSKISSVFHSQSPINPVSFSPYGTVLLALLARIRTAASLYYLNTSLYWQRCQLISVLLQSTFHQDVA